MSPGINKGTKNRSGYLTTLSERRAQADARRTVRSDGSRAYQQPLRTDAEQLCCILLSTHLSGVRVGEAGGRPPPSLPITWREAGSRGARRPPPRSIVRSGRLSRESERERDNLGMRMRRLHHAVSVSQNVAISILSERKRRGGEGMEVISSGGAFRTQHESGEIPDLY
ncbi:hypothetical protein Tco_1064264 [Tanacetum coccineum]